MTAAGWAQFGPAPSVEKVLGSLPVVADFCRRLRIRELVDELCPMREVSTSVVSHGQMIEVLVANRLTAPTPLADVQGWAQEWAVGEVFGVLPEALNDDRAGRALDAIAGVPDKITGSVGLTAIEAFGLEVTRMHWDMTSISLHGTYPQTEEGFAVPKFGHPKDRRPDLKQIQTGLAVTGDGGVPVFHRAYDGGAGEVGQVVGAMQALQQLAGPARMLIVGDSKLVSYTNLATMIDQEVAFIAPASKTYVPVEVLAAQEVSAATEVDHVAARDAGKPVEQRGRWHVREDTITLAGPRRKDPVLRLRRVFVHSSARAEAAAVARAKKLDRAGDDLARLARGLGSRHYPDTAAVTARIQAIARERRVGAYLRAAVTTCPQTGKPLLDWHFDPDAIAAEAAGDGWYALLTNQTPADADPAQILRSYKGQEAVERRYHGFKGPLAVAPMFLRNNKRMTALITVICLALLIYCLIERQVRTAIAPATVLPGLNAGRPAKPTTDLIFKALRPLRLIPASNSNPPVIPQPTPHQLRLLNLLAVDPRRPRDD